MKFFEHQRNPNDINPASWGFRLIDAILFDWGRMNVAISMLETVYVGHQFENLITDFFS